MEKKSAKGVQGFLLYDPLKDEHFFRVYGEVDLKTGRKEFTDYNVCAEDIKITIESDDLSLYKSDGDNRLSWSKTF